MFKKLRNRIILTTMVVATVVLLLSGTIIMVSASTMRPEPKPHLEPNNDTAIMHRGDEELREFIKADREEGNARLLVTLLCVGAVIEVAVFLIVFYLSQKIVEPVKDSYNKQRVFIANASHELKTPLAVIQANIEALDVDKNNEKWKNNIETEVSHANKLVLDLLQLAKMDAGSIKKRPEKVDLDMEIKKRIELFRPKFNGTIKFTAKNNYVGLLPKQDMLQVLDILLDNATKYGDKKISIILDNANVAISNDGATIADGDLEKVFDRFYQTDKTKEGSGLGLAIAKAICEQNGWVIDCRNVRRCTCFTVMLAERNR